MAGLIDVRSQSSEFLPQKAQKGFDWSADIFRAPLGALRVWFAVKILCFLWLILSDWSGLAGERLA
jgi:hypothetical protein